jgi:hypothetical protein
MATPKALAPFSLTGHGGHHVRTANVCAAAGSATVKPCDVGDVAVPRKLAACRWRSKVQQRWVGFQWDFIRYAMINSIKFSGIHG